MFKVSRQEVEVAEIRRLRKIQDERIEKVLPQKLIEKDSDK